MLIDSPPFLVSIDSPSFIVLIDSSSFLLLIHSSSFLMLIDSPSFLVLIDSSHEEDTRRAYQCIKFLVTIGNKIPQVKEYLVQSTTKWQWAVDWLKQKVSLCSLAKLILIDDFVNVIKQQHFRKAQYYYYYPPASRLFLG